MCVWQSPNLSILFDPDPDCAPRADRLSRLCLYPFFCLSLTSPFSATVSPFLTPPVPLRSP
ncbi:U4/U6.U5 tri-snRNP-associated protein 2-like [Iris pallida]|uniref:U4/U6.U5 tri-snRNP-associated protein 2-like n=1 Tax=Iris pallida TaxID=29817 RepID=A0AAX6GW94_IRIPA|nr:U4/U6.U5 tri-snRNP-associated protein 2-like [Iris pallida]